MTATFDTKYVGEHLNMACSFSARMANDDTIATCTVTIAVVSGVDASPDDMLNGSAVLNSASFAFGGVITRVGQAVIQNVEGGVDGVVYELAYTATTTASGETLIEKVQLPVAA